MIYIIIIIVIIICESLGLLDRLTYSDWLGIGHFVYFMDHLFFFLHSPCLF